jgi:hypothetical protein
MFKKRYSGSYDRYIKTSAPRITIPKSYTTGQKRRPDNKVYIALIIAAAVAVTLFFLLRGCGGVSGNSRSAVVKSDMTADSGVTGKSDDGKQTDVKTTDSTAKKKRPESSKKEDPNAAGTSAVEKAGSVQPQPRKKIDLGTHVEIITK